LKDFLFSQTLYPSFKAAAFPWTLFYRNPLSREEKTDLSAPSIKFYRPFFVSCYLFTPVKRTSQLRKKDCKESRKEGFHWRALKIFSNWDHPRCIAQAWILRYLVFGNTYLSIQKNFPILQRILMSYCAQRRVSGRMSRIFIHMRTFDAAIPQFLNNRCTSVITEYWNILICIILLTIFEMALNNLLHWIL